MTSGCVGHRIITAAERPADRFDRRLSTRQAGLKDTLKGADFETQFRIISSCIAPGVVRCTTWQDRDDSAALFERDPLDAAQLPLHFWSILIALSLDQALKPSWKPSPGSYSMPFPGHYADKCGRLELPGGSRSCPQGLGTARVLVALWGSQPAKPVRPL